jgi:hypothetical protein
LCDRPFGAGQLVYETIFPFRARGGEGRTGFSGGLHPGGRNLSERKEREWESRLRQWLFFIVEIYVWFINSFENQTIKPPLSNKTPKKISQKKTPSVENEFVTLLMKSRAGSREQKVAASEAAKISKLICCGARANKGGKSSPIILSIECR